MALGILAIIFILMVVVSALGITFLYLVKNEKVKSWLFYFLSLWAMGIAYMNITRLASNYLGQQLLGWAFGFLAVAGVVIRLIKPEKTTIAQLLVTVAIIGGVVHILFF